jgi:hypothetical protein
MITITTVAVLLAANDPPRRPPQPRDLQHPTQREMSEPGWRPWMRWDWCTDARSVRFRCQR